jgi:hypothetical protein
LLSEYDIEDIFNADETALFYGLRPNKTLAHVNENIKGRKKFKNSITIVFACNASGTVKLQP